jgi:pimeloyl-ACP methyl ester carboxylesterase
MGGYVAQEMWRQAPARVERLALLDTNAIADAPEATVNRRALMALAGAEGLPAVVRLLMPRLLGPRAPSALAAILRTMARNTGMDAFLRQQTAIMQRIDGRAFLSQIACPVLVACGADDILTPPALHEDMTSRIPGATLEIFAACGHMSTLEQPLAVNQALRDWLARD